MSSANKVGYGLFNQSGIYINIMQFQISPMRKQIPELNLSKT